MAPNLLLSCGSRVRIASESLGRLSWRLFCNPSSGLHRVHTISTIFLGDASLARVQNHPLFAPGKTFWRGSGAKPPSFCTREDVLAGFRCKTALFLHPGRRSGGVQVQNHPFLHPGRRSGGVQVQNHPIFAPVEAFWRGSGAKTPPFCTWGGVLAGFRCKTTLFLHLGRRSGGVQVQKHPLFAPVEAFWRGSGAKPPHFCTREGVGTGLEGKNRG